MKTTIDRRTFLRIAGTSLGAGALYRVGPAFAAGGEGGETRRRLAGANGEGITPFTFVQLSDAHVGFQVPPNPTGTAAFERAVEVVNKMPEAPTSSSSRATSPTTASSRTSARHACGASARSRIACA